MSVSRRRFLQVGLMGGAALATAGAWSAWRVADRTRDEGTPLRPEGRAVLGALAPAFLAGVVPAATWTPEYTKAFVDRMATTIGALDPNARRELRQLFALLDVGAARIALAGTWRPWATMDATVAAGILTRWRYGRSALMTSAYQAMHDIVLGTWYAAPEAWPAIGYPGPPNLLDTPGPRA